MLTEANKAGTGRFDASDLMPAEVGSGSFWTGMVEYMKGGPDSLEWVSEDHRRQLADLVVGVRALATEVAEQQRERPPEGRSLSPGARAALRVAAFVGGMSAIYLVGRFALDFLRDKDSNRILVVLVAIVVGVGGVFALFWAMDRVVNWLPESLREGVRPYVYVGPAVVLLSIFLIYPVFDTLLTSFKDTNGQSWVGLDNYRFVFTDPSMLRSIRNTAGWVIVVPTVAVSIGLLFATLADRLLVVSRSRSR